MCIRDRPFSSKRAIAIQSPIINDIEVELVGAKFKGQASIGFLYRIPTLAFLCSKLLGLLVILISFILNRFVKLIILFNSDVSPEFEIAITQSFFFILPKSPWLASVAWTKYDGVPVDVRVAEILLPIWALLPTPVTTTFHLIE